MQVLIFFVYFINILGKVVQMLILGRVILSWVNMGRSPITGPISRFVYESTEPIMRVIRKMPHRIGMIDLSPIIAILGIDLLLSLTAQLINTL